MSKEQKCKCCQNYWYPSDLTNGLCPNCYDYVSATEAQNKRVLEKLELLVRSNQELEAKLAEKEKEVRRKVCDDVIKFMEQDGFDCSDWLDLFNLISGETNPPARR